MADARRIPLREHCVNCVVTSPPFWGLRDYGTARWEGGDPACDHLAPLPGGSAASGLANYDNGLRQDTIDLKITQRRQQFKQACGKCGAVRIDKQLGLEATPDAYVAALVAVFREVWRVLKDDGTVWLNLGDSYAGLHETGRRDSQQQRVIDGRAVTSKLDKIRQQPRLTGLKQKDLVGIPWRVAFALQADGWTLRSDIIWSKAAPMPESVRDRPTKSHEYLFLLSKQPFYYYDADAIKEAGATDDRPRSSWDERRHLEPIRRGDPALSGHVTKTGTLASKTGRNKRSVWHLGPEPFSGYHFATFPQAVVEPCILAGCPVGGLVFDPFIGSGTVGAVAERLGRRWVGTDLTYQQLAQKRTAQRGLRW